MTESVFRPLRPGDVAPNFHARTTKGELSLSSFRGKWVVMFSHPADFTPVCTSEFVALAKSEARFTALDCQLLGLSVDSLYAHFAWMKSIREIFEVDIPFPVIEDPSMAIVRAYGMIDDTDTDSSAVRATYFIDPEGVIRATTHYPKTIGRSVEEMIRVVAALQVSHSGERAAPEGWYPGDPLLIPPQAQITEGADWFCRFVP